MANRQDISSRIDESARLLETLKRVRSRLVTRKLQRIKRMQSHQQAPKPQCRMDNSLPHIANPHSSQPEIPTPRG